MSYTSAMKYMLIIPVFFLTTAYMAAPINEETMATPTCKTYIEWTGKNINDIDLSILDDRPSRVLKPDSMATMDYSPDRLNIHTTDDGVILSQNCG
jgi:hypothetical protein